METHTYGSVVVGLCLVIALLAATAVPGYAQRGGGGSPGGGAIGGGGAPGGSAGGGSHSGGGSPGGNWQGSGQWHGGGWQGGNWHGGGWRGGWWGPTVVIGAGPWWYPYYGYGYPYAYPYANSAYPPPVIVDNAPQTYIEQDAQTPQQDWYYCQNPQGYYPYISECPSGWQPVAPQPTPR
jgi:hypothetical protein